MEPVVLTSENSAAFYARKLDLAPEPPAAPAAEKPEGEPVVESAPAGEAAPEKDADGQQKNPDEAKQKLNLRFSELSRQRDTAQALADAKAKEAADAHAARELAEKRAKELELRLNPPKSPVPAAEPQLEQFKDALEYAKAYAEWNTEKALKERDDRDAEKRTIAERERVAKAWGERQAATKAEIPDYEATISASSVAVSDEVRDAILDSDVGPRILYHLAKNPDEAKALGDLSVRAALRKIGKLEAQLEKAAPVAEAKAPEKPAAAATEISRAPAPISPLKGANAPIEPPVNAAGEYVGDYATWKRLRAEGKIH